MYLIGFDIGSSSIKAALIEANSKSTVDVVRCPESEMSIQAQQAGWAEQNPEDWWKYICQATKKLLTQNNLSPEEIKGIGIAYQMHGLVLVDKHLNPLRSSIIWCDSRAVEIGNEAFASIGEQRCLSKLLNSPGNFTASKLKWVQENEPHIYEQIHKIMLPGDYIAMKLSNEINTTVSGLSEGILWDFEKETVADIVLDYYQIDRALIPDIVPTFSIQGKVSTKAAQETGLKEGTPITYRAGDQPNNALANNVLNPGEVAATGGTSGVVYAVVDKAVPDPFSRVNGFAHINHTPTDPRIGVLLCINGAGSQYSWIKHNVAQAGISYGNMEDMVSSVPVGSDGLRIIPFGNGGERILNNHNPGAQVNNLNFNIHGRAHFYRAALEGIAFSFVYGMEIIKEMGLDVQVVRVGNDNLFQSTTFSNTFSTLVGAKIEVLETTGAIGAAKAAGVAAGLYSSVNEAMANEKIVTTYEPLNNSENYRTAYAAWKEDLKKLSPQPKKTTTTY